MAFRYPSEWLVITRSRLAELREPSQNAPLRRGAGVIFHELVEVSDGSLGLILDRFLWTRNLQGHGEPMD